MRRSEYEDVPNRIIPPYIPMDSRHERPSRMPPAPSIRQPLLGDAPMDPYRQAYPPNVTFNGPVVDSYRRRGFDKGPSGEDYGKSEGRQPLLRHPKLAVEHLGGDMDISRSRSPSPEVQIIRDSRMVRDDRRRDRGDRSRRSRSRSRSRERRRSRSRTRDRARPVRDGLHSQVRDGIVHTNDNYYEFLSYFIDELNEKSRNSADRDVQGSRKLKETITSATEAEKDRIILPPDFNNSDRERMLHCDTTISGLPSSIFYGSGYGPREHYAKYSAAKDLIDKCHRIGVVNSELHAAIGDWKRMDRTFKSQFSTHISKAANAIILLVKKMASESLPSGFLTMRQLPTDLIDRFKTMLRMVMIDVYYDSGSTATPSALETGYESHRPRDSDMRKHKVGNGKEGRVEPSADEILRLKEKEIKERMDRELEKKRVEMEQEIRKQVLEEERAKIRAELEMEKKIELMRMQQQQYQLEKERKEAEEQQRKAAMLKQVEDEFNGLVGQLELQFAEVRSKGLSHVLDMIYSSPTFNTMQLYSINHSTTSHEQRQALVQDLKGLLDTITKEVARASALPTINRYAPMGAPMMGGYPGVVVPPVMPTYQMPQQLPHQLPPHLPQQLPQQLQQPLTHPSLPRVGTSSTSSSSATKSEKVHRLTIGNMQLRALNSTEQRRLKKGDKVIAQDSKTGNWSLATVMKINQDNRVTLAVGNASWKKAIEKLYKEDTVSTY